MDFESWDVNSKREAAAEDDDDYKTFRDCVLYAIEVSPSMLERYDITNPKTGEVSLGKSAVKLALEAVYEAVKDRLLSNPYDISGIILYGTKAETDSSYPLCNTIMPLGKPSATILRNLGRLIDLDESEFLQELEPDDNPPSLGAVFQLAMQQFDNGSYIKSARRFFIITDNDNPVHDNKQQRTAAKTNAEELINKNVIIEPAFLIRKNLETNEPSSFDMSIFWEDISFRKPSLEEEEEEIDTEPVPSSYIVSDMNMKKSLLSRHTIKRALFNNRIELAPGLHIGVKGYLNFSKKRFMAPFKVYTGGEEPKFVKSEVKTTVGESARVVDAKYIRKGYNFGQDDYVIFTPEQYEEIRKIEESPIIRIIGFKSPHLVPFEYNKRHSCFIYPSDSLLSGSIRAFNTLYREMLRKNRVGIAWAQLRKGSVPEPVALFPIAEETETVDGSTIQMTPPGIQIVHLPYADDIRSRPPSPYTNAPDVLVEKLAPILEKIKVAGGYNPDLFPNPSLRYKNIVLQAVALGEELPPMPKDPTEPKYNAINKRIGGMLEEWNGMLDDYVASVPHEDPPSNKRVRDSGGEPSSKKVKLGTDKEGFVQAAKEKKLDLYTVKELIEFSRANSIVVESRIKKDLIEAVSNYLKDYN